MSKLNPNLETPAKLESLSELHAALVVEAVGVLDDVADEGGVLGRVGVDVHARPRRRLVVVLVGGTR